MRTAIFRPDLDKLHLFPGNYNYNYMLLLQITITITYPPENLITITITITCPPKNLITITITCSPKILRRTATKEGEKGRKKGRRGSKPREGVCEYE